MNENEPVIDGKAFAALSEECNTIFDTSKRMPDFVFRRAFDRNFAIEYAYVYLEQFGLLPPENGNVL